MTRTISFFLVGTVLFLGTGCDALDQEVKFKVKWSGTSENTGEEPECPDNDKPFAEIESFPSDVKAGKVKEFEITSWTASSEVTVQGESEMGYVDYGLKRTNGDVIVQAGEEAIGGGVICEANFVPVTDIEAANECLEDLRVKLNLRSSDGHKNMLAAINSDREVEASGTGRCSGEFTLTFEITLQGKAVVGF